MNNNLNVLSVELHGNKILCKASNESGTITSCAKGELIRITKKFHNYKSLYNHIIKCVAKMGGDTSNTEILCARMRVLDRINEVPQLNEPEYRKTHTNEERAELLQVSMTLGIHGNNRYIVFVDMSQKELLNEGATHGFYKKMSAITMSKHQILYKLEKIESIDMNYKKYGLWGILAIVILALILIFAGNNGNQTKLSNVNNIGTIQMIQNTNNPNTIQTSM